MVTKKCEGCINKFKIVPKLFPKFWRLFKVCLAKAQKKEKTNIAEKSVGCV
jgi:hypothetical protein